MRDSGLFARWDGMPDSGFFRRGGAWPLPRPEGAVFEQPGVSTPGTGEPDHQVLKGRPTAEVSAGPSGLEKLSACHPGLKPRAVQSSPFQGEGGDKPLPYENTRPSHPNALDPAL